MINPQHFIDLLLFSFGGTGASDSVQCAVYGGQQHRCITVSLEDPLERRPASDVSGTVHGMDDRIEQLVGEHRDEDMSIHALFELVMVRTKPKVGFQHAKALLRLGKGHVQRPEALSVKFVMVGSQDIASEQIGVSVPCFFGSFLFSSEPARLTW